MKETILVLYSGGLDSTVMLHLLLTQEKYKQYNIHVHHVHIRNQERRAVAETAAVTKSLQWFIDNEYREFSYSDADITFGSYNNKFLFDTDVTYFFAGYIASCDKSITKIAYGATATDFEEAGLNDRVQRSRNIFKAFVDIERILPLLELTKTEIYQLLPEGLRDKFWSCRKPVYANRIATPCGQCKTCKQLEEFGIKNNTLALV